MAANDDILAKIETNPDDRDLYLVYSDQLQETGDPRGELIALQHALESDPENAEIQARVDELMRKHRTTWLKRFAWFSADNLEMTWRLGFLYEVQLDRRGKDDAASCVSELFRLPAARLLRSLWIKVDSPERIWKALLEAQPRVVTLEYLHVRRSHRHKGVIPEEIYAAFPRLRLGERKRRLRASKQAGRKRSRDPKVP